MNESKKQNYNDRFASFYNSKQWRSLRQAKWDAVDGLCELCKKKGIIREAIDIHHIVPIAEDWSKRLDYDNLLALCKDCHNQMHERISPLQKFLEEWDKL